MSASDDCEASSDRSRADLDTERLLLADEARVTKPQSGIACRHR
jgi:hypothetical protein